MSSVAEAQPTQNQPRYPIQGLRDNGFGTQGPVSEVI
jgi:hypothetical protein